MLLSLSIISEFSLSTEDDPVFGSQSSLEFVYKSNETARCYLPIASSVYRHCLLLRILVI